MQPAEPEEEGVEDHTAFVLAKYLEDFILSNFQTTSRVNLRAKDGMLGQQYPTDIGPIDVLSVQPTSNSFVVIELKKGRSSDQVVGQILR